MKLILLFGPQAVGKMTVGEELAKITDLKLFHNHMTIELVSNFFSFSSPEGKRLVYLFRKEIFEAFARSDSYGMIFTYVWAFNDEDDWFYADKLCRLFKQQNAEIYFVELEADFEERLKRNKSPHRLDSKPTKRNLEWSEQDLRNTAQKYRLNSYPGELNVDNYLKINNTHMNPEEAARLIKEHFQLY